MKVFSTEACKATLGDFVTDEDLKNGRSWFEECEGCTQQELESRGYLTMDEWFVENNVEDMN